MKKTLILAFSLLLLAASVLAEESFINKDLQGRDFHERVMNGTDFSGSTLDFANFRGASLKRTIFKRSSLNLTHFEQADLSDADLTGATGAISFYESKLRNANLHGLNVRIQARCDVHGANLSNARLESSFLECDMTEADLRGTNMAKSRISQGAGGMRFGGALYNDDTVWPAGFDLEASGAVKK